MIFIAAANGGTIPPLSEGNVNNLSILTIVMQNCPTPCPWNPLKLLTLPLRGALGSERSSGKP